MEPPDPMFTKDSPKKEIALWWLCALVGIVLFILSIPVLYPIRYVKGLKNRKHLSYNEMIKELESQDRYVTETVLGFLKAEGHCNYARFKYTILPSWHPAATRVIVKAGTNRMEVSGSW